MIKISSILIFLITPILLFSQEICNNGIDDDMDGLIDIQDPDCACQADAFELDSLGTACTLLRLSAQLEGDHNYQWYKDGQALDGEDKPFVTLTPAAEPEGAYVLQAINESACVESVAYAVHIPSYETQLADIYLPAGETQVLNGVTIMPGSSYTWDLLSVNGCDSTIYLNVLVDTTNVSSVFDRSISDRLQLAPNPTDGLMSFSLDTEVLSIRLMDSQGRFEILSPIGSQIDISNYPSGLYFLIFDTSEGLISRKIIKH